MDLNFNDSMVFETLEDDLRDLEDYLKPYPRIGDYHNKLLSLAIGRARGSEESRAMLRKELVAFLRILRRLNEDVRTLLGQEAPR